VKVENAAIDEKIKKGVLGKTQEANETFKETLKKQNKNEVKLMSSSNPTKERIGENNLHFRRAEGYKQVVVDIEGTTEKAFFDFDEKTGKPKFAGNGKTNEKKANAKNIELKNTVEALRLDNNDLKTKLQHRNWGLDEEKLTKLDALLTEQKVENVENLRTKIQELETNQKNEEIEKRLEHLSTLRNHLSQKLQKLTTDLIESEKKHEKGLEVYLKQEKEIDELKKEIQEQVQYGAEEITKAEKQKRSLIQEKNHLIIQLENCQSELQSTRYSNRLSGLEREKLSKLERLEREGEFDKTLKCILSFLAGYGISSGLHILLDSQGTPIFPGESLGGKEDSVRQARLAMKDFSAQKDFEKEQIINLTSRLKKAQSDENTERFLEQIGIMNKRIERLEKEQWKVEQINDLNLLSRTFQNLPSRYRSQTLSPQTFITKIMELERKLKASKERTEGIEEISSNSNDRVVRWVRGIKRNAIAEIYHHAEELSQLPKITVGEKIFVTLNDGTTLDSLQVIIAQKNDLSSQINFGGCLLVSGKLFLTPQRKQFCELKASEISFSNPVISDCPLQKKNIPLEVVRDYPHLRTKTNYFLTLFRLRHSIIPTPIITSNDAEGAGETFNITTEFFAKSAKLTVSGQLHAEALAQGLGKVYTFSPCFRAEKSHTTPEMVLVNLNEVIDFVERLIKYVINYVLDVNRKELKYLEEYNKEKPKEIINKLKKVVNKPFKRIDFAQTGKILKAKKENFEDLPTEQEKYLCQYFAGPVFITNYPSELKAFYMQNNSDGNTVAGFDLIFPEIGELIGGSLRESDYQILRKKTRKTGLTGKNMD
ncbi:6442_t:CDS:10, partial [Racocetra fulgida]